MFLAIDIGNTNITCAVFRDNIILEIFRLKTNINLTADEYHILFKNILAAKKIDIEKIKKIGISSVVPLCDNLIFQAFKNYNLCVPKFIEYSPTLKLNVKIKIKEPWLLGADRLVNAEYCAENFPDKDVIVIDFGTATTFDVLTADRDYIGGIIAPGVELSAAALFKSAAKLFTIDYSAPPETIVCDNTTDCIKSGLIYGYISLTEGLLQKIITERKFKEPLIIATGGFGKIITPLTKGINIYDEQITLKGIKLIYEKNF